MSGTEELKDLLDRLKDEVGPIAPEEAPPPRPARALERPAAQPQSNGYGRFHSPYRQDAQREHPREPGVNLIWSENKETMLFGVLASLILAMGGLLSGLDYLVLVGAVFFMLFSLVMFLALFGYYLSFRRRGSPDQGLVERVDALSKKVEMLGAKTSPGGAPAAYSGPEKERELEHKVEELRVLVKSLARSVEQNNK